MECRWVQSWLDPRRSLAYIGQIRSAVVSSISAISFYLALVQDVEVTHSSYQSEPDGIAISHFEWSVEGGIFVVIVTPYSVPGNIGHLNTESKSDPSNDCTSPVKAHVRLGKVSIVSS